ncbi:uncharacterized protein K489DRAFT_336176 [Dissoconium aciculare CBS 342.82]|uniref:Chalcone isomerase domain-containing protein n=1 Tax=Dissoconium aciculare CBS 342.82 TaxID=1314786 RepID=A0A6J3M999_9PEZI|nr:uncharacterized protein K489DRAFT_336176 [Dissoconium aciculare CBS 342.82]KAF1824590.1 hypothetical protein K489DRAFT_336176 [Dissoconium aciculare CBS 342.82]
MAYTTRAAARLPGTSRIIVKPRQSIALPSQVRHASTRYSCNLDDAGSRTSNASTTRLNARANYLAWEEKRQYHLRRMRFAGMGLFMSIAATFMLLYNIDLDKLEQSAAKKRAGQQLDASSEANEQFQGKKVHVIGAGEGKRIVAHGKGGDIELIETGTSSVPHFPRTISLPVSSVDPSTQPAAGPASGPIGAQEEYTLIGLGIRSVSFLSIQVYVVGMYIRSSDISSLQEKLIHNVNGQASTLIPSEKEKLREVLLDPGQSREIWNDLLQVPGLKTAWRIAPTRNTDFGHLRDGWITGISNRTREARSAAKGAETEYDAEDFGKAVGDFKSIFTGGKAPKGSVMILARDTTGDLDVWFQAKPDGAGPEKAVQKLGTVTDERISRLIWLGYLGGEKVSSEAARKGIVEGCVGFASRPIGSVETMVT